MKKLLFVLFAMLIASPLIAANPAGTSSFGIFGSYGITKTGGQIGLPSGYTAAESGDGEGYDLGAQFNYFVADDSALFLYADYSYAPMYLKLTP
ncbi:MAG TPA: hypothetical protein DHW82_13200 [Spirochaetia bacterium]|nr:MAG: hypothetical protein A2Y41_02445 [Spirochaetes bacterium GWB1_36_13]HCL57946.1 hypothetical protein [Spirochaetia bacterium]